jgi:hypothetical protein
VFLQVTDPGESNDLSSQVASKPELHQALVKLQARLTELSKTGAPMPEIVNKSVYKETLLPRQCYFAQETGFWLPSDWQSGPIPSPAPTPSQNCNLLYKTCGNCTTDSTCTACSKNISTQLSKAKCHPKERKAYCNRTHAAWLAGNCPGADDDEAA